MDQNKLIWRIIMKYKKTNVYIIFVNKLLIVYIKTKENINHYLCKQIYKKKKNDINQ